MMLCRVSWPIQQGLWCFTVDNMDFSCEGIQLLSHVFVSFVVGVRLHALGEKATYGKECVEIGISGQFP